MVKGNARACTALLISDVVMHAEFNFKEIFPEVHHSLCIIAVKQVLYAVSTQQIAFQNAALSSAGSIRRQHDMMTWLHVLTNLKQADGIGVSSSVKQWNAPSRKSTWPPAILKSAKSTEVWYGA